MKADEACPSKQTADPALAAITGAPVNARCMHRCTVHSKPNIVVGIAVPVGSTRSCAAQDSTAKTEADFIKTRRNIWNVAREKRPES